MGLTAVGWGLSADAVPGENDSTKLGDPGGVKTDTF